MKTWWERASTKQRLAQIDGGIECGMNSAQVAKNCGAAIYTNGNAVLSLAHQHGRSFPNIKSAAGLARIKRAAARTSFYGRAHQEINSPDAFSIFGAEV
ncbi:hypothetical protein [Rhizobium sp. Root483D2]|uniref:hypothetical protein n=1 Tax=Rhizobium sp. Root483D2 TaxID=1736545 RepID=UPI000715C10C|nr:hypothetical protein [Rhizobium sp. Root483D2]KQY39969.1 hypothetical protein ASD32_16310 [Rhizobium sp. Root483D2]